MSEKSRLSALGKVAKSVAGWQPAREVLTRVRAVETEFVQLNRATRVGGWPIERFALVHGPSNMGKTVMLHGLGLSFLKRGHFYCYVDAEFSTPEDWLVKLMAEHADNPAFIAQRPHSFEQTVDSVRSILEAIATAREKKQVPKETTALVVVDSIRKLVPQRLIAAIDKHGADSKKGSVDGMSGRAAMYKAALNGQWLDELTPLLYHTGTALVFVGREIENTEQGAGIADWKLTGGKGIYFDSSLACRVTRAEWVKQGSGDNECIVGERHRVRIHKTKVGGKEDKVTDAYFHTSNGVLIPEGFDRARDVLELAIEGGRVQQDSGGGWLTWTETGVRWRGINAAVKQLTESPALLADLEAEIEAGAPATAADAGG